MSVSKFVFSTAAVLALSGIVACSHRQRHNDVDASASAPAVQPSIASGMTTDSPTAPADLGASTSGRGL